MELPVKVRTRGIFRLQRRTCWFPNLRLNFPKEETEGTLFEGQDKLKMVNYCQDQDSYEQNVLEEYLVYRIYNILTDMGFLVRLARITYVDTSGKDDPLTRMGFILEHEDAMAARQDGTVLEVASASAESFQQDQAALLYVFQYMIGNTDWSITRSHNVTVMRIGWSEYYPVPFDFDFSGLVDAPYAAPNPVIAHLIRSVRQRLYRGICNDAIDYQAVFARFIEKQDEILELVRTHPPELSERNRRDAARYLEDFYRVITDEGRARRYIVDVCRK
jgi:hypothetical protein